MDSTQQSLPADYLEGLLRMRREDNEKVRRADAHSIAVHIDAGCPWVQLTVSSPVCVHSNSLCV